MTCADLTTIIPVYKPDMALLQAAVRSALRAGASEVLVVFDHDRDTADAYAKTLRARVRQGWRHAWTGAPAQGPSCARNIGIDLTETKLVSFLDADDEYVDDVLEDAAARFQARIFEAVYLGVRCVRWPSREQICTYGMPKGWASERAFAQIHHPLLPVVRTEVARQVRFRPHVRFAEDVLFNAEVISRGRAWSHPTIGYEYRVLDASLSHRGFDPDFSNTIDRYYADMASHPDTPMKAMFQRKREINRQYSEFLSRRQAQGLPFMDFHTWITAEAQVA
jgi:glycosyltransferase involved in cell wall biosynthesis